MVTGCVQPKIKCRISNYRDVVYDAPISHSLIRNSISLVVCDALKAQKAYKKCNFDCIYWMTHVNEFAILQALRYMDYGSVSKQLAG